LVRKKLNDQNNVSMPKSNIMRDYALCIIIWGIFYEAKFTIFSLSIPICTDNNKARIMKFWKIYLWSFWKKSKEIKNLMKKNQKYFIWRNWGYIKAISIFVSSTKALLSLQLFGLKEAIWFCMKIFFSNSYWKYVA
jgi:hypothetical protein